MQSVRISGNASKRVEVSCGQSLLSGNTVGVKFYGSMEKKSPIRSTSARVKANYRVINASGVLLPPLPWYKKIKIPGLLSSKPSPYSNKIRTTKYTIFNFIFKNLWEQFHRWANIYFLFIVILNFIPQVEAVGKEVAYLPLLSVLVAIALKDLLEDYRRYRSDREVNGRLCAVYNEESGEFVPRKWSDVRLGNFIKLRSDDVIPADLLLLYSSDPLGICYIETANIDGETNLKQRQVAAGCGHTHKEEIKDTFTLADFPGTLFCEQPHNKIYEFNGYIHTPTESQEGVNRSNLLLRGCVLRNTTAVVGVVVYAGHETKSMLNNSGPRAKRSKLERGINIEVGSQVLLLAVLCLIGVIFNSIWSHRRLDSNSVFFPYTSGNYNIYLEGFIRFWTFLIIFQVIIPISLYVTIELVKVMQVFFVNGDVEMYYKGNDFPFQCRALNITEDLGQIQYVFSDKTGTLTENKMAFRCCSVGDTNYQHTIKHDLVRVQTEELGRNLSAISDEKEITAQSEGKIVLDPKLLANLSDPDVRDFFTVLAVCNTVVVSVTDHHRSRVESLPFMDPSFSVSNDYINKLKYEAESPDEAALVKAAHDYGFILLSRSPTECCLLTPEGDVIHYDILHTLEFDSARKCMSIMVRQKGKSEVILYSKGADSAIFDRLASTESSFFQESGFVEINSASLSDGEREPRERPSYLDRPGVSRVRRVRGLTQTFIDIYARLGLRTLCMAKRVLTSNEYVQWYENRHKAEVSLENRDELLLNSISSIERGLTLLGATGIEDKLQAGVPTAIATLQAAGIKVWVLTGDKQETAINIGYSSCLIQPGMEVVTLNAYSVADCKAQLTNIQARFQGLEISAESSTDSYMNGSSGNGGNPISGSGSSVSKCSLHQRLLHPSRWRKTAHGRGRDGTRPAVLVVDGPTLVHALSPSLKDVFLEVASQCTAVMCCRATPLQKASVVELVKTGLDQMTLAVGDGANDVSMIQKANVGVGIAGREGMQAVMASDFAMGRFRFLVRLLLVHGHWTYNRLARLMLYFFYKNVCYATLLFWYQFFNGFSGSAAIDSINLIIFNLVYTSLPIMVMGVADQDLPAEVLLDKKVFYSQGRCSRLYTRLMFWLTILDAFYQSAVVFFVAYAAYRWTDVGVAEFGIVINTSVVIVVSLHLAIETMHWTAVNHLLLWGSIIVTFVFNYIYCAIDTRQRIIDTLFVMQMASTRAIFWLVLIITPVIALLPRVLAKVIHQEVWPTQVMKARSDLYKFGRTFLRTRK